MNICKLTSKVPGKQSRLTLYYFVFIECMETKTDGCCLSQLLCICWCDEISLSIDLFIYIFICHCICTLLNTSFVQNVNFTEIYLLLYQICWMVPVFYKKDGRLENNGNDWLWVVINDIFIWIAYLSFLYFIILLLNIPWCTKEMNVEVIRTKRETKNW